MGEHQQMTTSAADELTRVVETAVAKLERIDEEVTRVKPGPTKWSKQEILGHLIDSSANNHQRFLRAQEADLLVFPRYEQNTWVSVQGYNSSSWSELVELWRLYNAHLAQVIRRIPEEKLAMECRIGPNDPVSLRYLVEDYVVHQKHHLAQIL